MNILPVFLAATLLLSVVAPPIFAQEARPKIVPNYVSKKAGFAVWFPGKAREGTKQATMAGMGAVSVRFVYFPPPPVAYTVIPTPLPGTPPQDQIGRFLEGVQRGLLLSSNGKLLSARSMKQGKYPGREIVWSFAGNRGHARVFLVGSRSLQVLAIAPTAQFSKNKAQIQKVLDSFQIL